MLVALTGFERHYIQPMDGPLLDENIKLCVDYVMKHPRWTLSIQLHKFLGLD